MRSATSFVILLAVALGCSVARAQDHTGLQPPERLAMSDTVQDALENNKTNASSEWVNPDTGNSGGVTPVRTFENDLGQPCREFLSKIIIAGREAQGYGTACRQPDGSWHIVSDEAPAAEAPPAPSYTPVVTPPAAYYDYPADFYYPYHIYLSFGLVYREGAVFRGVRFLDGPSFRHRYPFRVRERIIITPRDRAHYHRMADWWQPWDRHKRHHHYGHREPRGSWRNRDW